MDSPLKFDHIVLVVRDLKKAISDYESLGFTVTPGGVHYKGVSENALIFLEDGTFIELLALRKSLLTSGLRSIRKTKFFKRWQYSPDKGIAFRFYSRAMELPEGMSDYSLFTPNPEKEYERITQEGIFMTTPLQAGRKKPDGSSVTWIMYTPYIADLPFIRGPYEPSGTPDPNLVKHQNGVKGISALHQLTLDYKDSVNKYKQLLCIEPKEQNNSATFADRKFKYTLYRSSRHSDLQKSLSGKGIGLFGVTFDGLSQVLSTEKLHGLVVV